MYFRKKKNKQTLSNMALFFYKYSEIKPPDICCLTAACAKPRGVLS